MARPCEHCNHPDDPGGPSGRDGTIHVTDLQVDGYHADAWLCPSCARDYRDWIAEEWRDDDRRRNADPYPGGDVTPMNAWMHSDACGFL